MIGRLDENKNLLVNGEIIEDNKLYIDKLGFHAMEFIEGGSKPMSMDIENKKIHTQEVIEVDEIQKLTDIPFIDEIGFGEFYGDVEGTTTIGTRHRTNEIEYDIFKDFLPLHIIMSFVSRKSSVSQLNIYVKGINEDGKDVEKQIWGSPLNTSAVYTAKSIDLEYVEGKLDGIIPSTVYLNIITILNEYTTMKIIIKSDNNEGEVVYQTYYDAFLEFSSCYLTTTMVNYYGKADDGIELTAMRKLREKYQDKHKETLENYYKDSVTIINEIERLDMEEHYYNYIKSVVDDIVILIDNEEWGVAEQLYLNLYYELKKKLIRGVDL